MVGPFKVIWKHRTLQHSIANIVLRVMQSGGDTGAITQAMASVDQLLAKDPLGCSESRDDFERILIAQPLVVDFEIYEEEKVVYILRARYAPKREK